jgi:hypothetical protein
MKREHGGTQGSTAMTLSQRMLVEDSCPDPELGPGATPPPCKLVPVDALFPSADGGTTGTGASGSGTITITTRDAHSITGTLDTSFALPPGHLTGPFTATACAPDAG